MRERLASFLAFGLWLPFSHFKCEISNLKGLDRIQIIPNGSDSGRLAFAFQISNLKFEIRERDKHTNGRRDLVSLRPLAYGVGEGLLQHERDFGCDL